jgi:hypothetical protein
VHEIGKHQEAIGIRGDVAEIGVHHGQLLIFLLMLLRGDECAVAIDLFEDQKFNVDGSGKGDREVMVGNVIRYCPKLINRIATISRDSRRIRPGEIRSAGGKSVRIFSVDGGHRRDVVINDLFLAADALHDAGVVILDDVFNAFFPGVGEGLAEYIYMRDRLRSKFSTYTNVNRRLTPFAIGCNKVLLAFEPYSQRYLNMLMVSPLAAYIRGKAIGWGVEDIPVFEI